MDWLKGKSTVEIYVQISHMETATEIGQSIKEGRTVLPPAKMDKQ